MGCLNQALLPLQSKFICSWLRKYKAGSNLQGWPALLFQS